MQNDIKAIADHYGYEPQSRQLVEEMAELTVALNKYWRKNVHHAENKETHDEYTNVIEEIADVEVMLGQIKYLLNCSEAVEGVKEQKIKRQLSRIHEEEINNG